MKGNKSYIGMYLCTCLCLGGLFLLLLVLRLANILTISWLWILAPLWMSPWIIAVILLFFIIYTGIKEGSFSKKKYIHGRPKP